MVKMKKNLNGDDLNSLFYGVKSSSSITLSICSIWRDKDTIKVKKINDGETHLVIGPTTYFLCLYFSKLHLPFIFINEEDIYPFFMGLVNEYLRTHFKHSKLSNYFLKISKFSSFNALIAQTFIKSYHLKSLTSVEGH